jgi:hypothetical protein
LDISIGSGKTGSATFTIIGNNCFDPVILLVISADPAEKRWRNITTPITTIACGNTDPVDATLALPMFQHTQHRIWF